LLSAGQYAKEAVANSIQAEADNRTAMTLLEMAYRTHEREEKMQMYWLENSNKSIIYYGQAVDTKRSVYQFCIIGIGVAVACSVYFIHCMVKDLLVPHIERCLEYHVDDGRQRTISISWNEVCHMVQQMFDWILVSGRNISSTWQHFLIFMVTIGCIHVTYNELDQMDHAASIVLYFAFLAATIQTISLHLLPNFLSEFIPRIVSYVQQGQQYGQRHVFSSLHDDFRWLSQATLYSIFQHTMLRFIILFILFLLEFLCIWLLVGNLVLNQCMIQFWQQWYVILFVVVSILAHLLAYEDIFGTFNGDISVRDYGSDEATDMSASHDDDDENSKEGIDIHQTNAMTVGRMTDITTEGTPLLPSSNGDENEIQHHLSANTSKGATEQFPGIFLNGGPHNGSTLQSYFSSRAGEVTSFSPYFVRFIDDIQRLIVVAEVLSIACSVHVFINLYNVLLSTVVAPTPSEHRFWRAGVLIGIELGVTLLFLLVVGRNALYYLFSRWNYQQRHDMAAGPGTPASVVKPQYSVDV
jgi:hypothetical protein